MQCECNLNSSERGVLCRSAKAPYKEKAHTRRGRTSTPPLPPRRKRALPTWWQRRCNENTFNNSCTYRQYRSTTRRICPDERDSSYSGYSCSKPPRGTGGSREPPVPVKGVQAILAKYSCLDTPCRSGTWRPAILTSRLWAAGLRHLG